MLAISHLPSGISHYTKKAIVCLITMTLDIVILCTARPFCTSAHSDFVVQGDPARPGENTNECSELMSAQTHREKSGGLCCLLWFQSTSTTRPSKHSESFYSLTVLPPASTPTPPPGCCFLSLAPEWRSGGESEWGGTTASHKHRRRKPPSWLIDFVFSS